MSNILLLFKRCVKRVIGALPKGYPFLLYDSFIFWFKTINEIDGAKWTNETQMKLQSLLIKHRMAWCHGRGQFFR